MRLSPPPVRPNTKACDAAHRTLVCFEATLGRNPNLLMSNDKRDPLTVLRAELEFVEKGGYRNTDLSAWRPQFIFQDSPTCLNSDPAKPPRPCNECVLNQFVPVDLRRRNISCRHIPLNEQGETIDFFYRCGTREELESALRKWLRATIRRLEVAQAMEESGETEIHVRARAAQVE